MVKHIFDPVLKMTGKNELLKMKNECYAMTDADSIANQKEPWVICGDVVIYANKTLKQN